MMAEVEAAMGEHPVAAGVKLGVPKTAMSAIFKGSQTVSEKHFVTIAKHLDVSLEVLKQLWADRRQVWLASSSGTDSSSSLREDSAPYRIGPVAEIRQLLRSANVAAARLGTPGREISNLIYNALALAETLPADEAKNTPDSVTKKK